MKILILLLNIYFFNINIWEPQQLSTLYKNKSPNYVIANFGVVPYGSNIFGTVYFGSPLDGCANLNPLGNSLKNESKIILFERGGCHFAQKVLNAQNLGAVLVIIGDNNKEDVHSLLPIEKTKEISEKIKIPSIILSNEDYNNFVDSLNNNKENIELYVNFSLKKSNEKSTLKIFIDVEDFETYKIIRRLESYYNNFYKNMNIKLIFKTQSKVKLLQTNMMDNLSCFNDKYCTDLKNINSKNNNAKNKKDKIGETIRQMCLFIFDDLKNYFKYLNYYLDNAFKNKDGNYILKGNFISIMDKYFNGLNLNPSVSECIKNPLDGFKNFEEDQKNLKINYTPLIYINGYIIKSTLNINNLIDAFCNSFLNPPAHCKDLNLYPEITNYSTLQFILYIFIISVSVVLFSFILFYLIYKKLIKREINYKINERINEALNKYYNQKEGENDENKEGNEIDKIKEIK